MFKNKILLVTGGTGSFGNAVVNRFLKEDVKEIRIFSRDEKKQDDMRNAYKDDRLKFYVGDVRDFNSVDLAMRDVNYVFNAAALKQVPSCEFFPIEAVKTNILGTENVLNAAIMNKVEKVVILSTDKAVYPINAMGMTKALMEKVMVAKARTNTNGTLLCGTRYGNVMASRGSVIPLFIDQIKHDQPLTVTNPNMTRFMMTLDDAINLVLYAFEHGNPGDIFVQKSPAATIGDLAQAVKALFNVDSEVRIIGTRHGEKLYETLLTSEEMAVAQDLGNYYRIPMDDRDLNYSKYLNQGEVRKDNVESYTSHNAKRLSLEELKQLLLKVDLVRDELKKWRA
ncbi:MAG: polysaccharide biosynthesis protein [Candidatus Parvarchaeota archaeon]|nr:polysaccharide biosynthesis protein [Candidatus Jingweiarchaeum tengchongense]